MALDQKRVISITMEEVVYRCDEGVGSLTFLWGQPSFGHLNEHEYQTVATGEKMAFKIDGIFGEFLAVWQAWIQTVKDVLWPEGKKCLFVTTNYDREFNVKLWETAMGIESALALRIGSLGLGDNHFENKFFAMSPTLAPKALRFGPNVVSVEGVPKKGVIGEPLQIFTPRPLPEDVRAFLEQKPTIAVTLSSFGQIEKLVGLFPSAGIQVLFVDSKCQNDLNTNHLHYADMLDLDEVFAKAALIVHGCGVGTVNQVAFSGKPSIAVSSMIEQELNGEALEAAGIAKHFTLKALWYQEGNVVESFRSTVAGFLEGAADLGKRLIDVQTALEKEKGAALQTLCNALDELMDKKSVDMDVQ